MVVREPGAGTGRVRLGAQSSIQRQARALGDPTRFNIFRAVADAPAPVRVAELTERFGVNHNAVRQHLAKLCDAGLLVEEVATRPGRGRPPLQYRVAADAARAWARQGPYEQLSLLLLEMVRTGRPARAVGREAGERVGAELAGSGEPSDRIEWEMGRRGFEPRRVERGTKLELVLGRCPFEAAAYADPDVVCELHRGLAEGMAEGLGGELAVTKLVVRDPGRAGCRLELRRVVPPA